MADLTRDDILHLARLCRIDLSDDEVTEFAGEFSEILEYVEQLNAVDTSGFKPTSQVTGLTNVARDDQVINYGYAPNKLMANVPVIQDGQIKVRRMVG